MKNSPRVPKWYLDLIGNLQGEPIVSKTTLYKNGPQLKPADLSEPLRKQCENRTIIQLVQETPSDVDDIIRTELTDIENDEGK